MNLLMLSGDRSLAAGKAGAFLQTLQGLSAHFDRIDVLCPCVAREERHPALPENVFFHPSPWSLWRQPLWIAREGKRLHAEHRYGVMTAHDYPPFYNGIGAWLLSREIGVPYALEVHHVVGWPKAANIGEWVGRLLSRLYLPWASRRATAVRVVNRDVTALLLSWGVAKHKLRVVPSFYLDTQMLQQRTGAPSVDAAFCGRLVANKGLFDFLAAVRREPTLSAVVIGDGPARKKAEAYCASCGMTERVRFLGWLPTAQDVVNAMCTAKVLVMCSKSEGGPRVVLEAMACGIPVVVTPVGLMPELITGENGLLTTGTPADIAAKIRTITMDPARADAISSLARATVLPRFDRAVTLPAYAEFLRSLAL